jgi:hypothetical protein
MSPLSLARMWSREKGRRTLSLSTGEGSEASITWTQGKAAKSFCFLGGSEMPYTWHNLLTETNKMSFLFFPFVDVQAEARET